MGWCQISFSGFTCFDLGATLIKILEVLRRKFICGIDRIILREYGIEPFTYDPECILRIVKIRNSKIVSLSEGSIWEIGDPLIEIHLWNERLANFQPIDSGLLWRRFLLNFFRSSLALLAEYIERSGLKIVGIRGETGFIVDIRTAQDIFKHLDFDVEVLEQPGCKFWRTAFWENIYSFLLMWTYRQGSLRGKHLTDLQRVQVRMSARKFESRYRNLSVNV
jgi:hypothetical protein